MPRCAACPVPASVGCDGTLCRLAGSPEWDRHIAGRAVLIASAADGPPSQAAVPAQGTLPLAESIRRVAAINACPDRTPTPGCGCSGTATCARDGLLKTRDQCWGCVARPAESAPR